MLPIASIILLSVLLSFAIGRIKYWKNQANCDKADLKWWTEFALKVNGENLELTRKNRTLENIHAAQHRLIESREQQIEILQEKYSNAIRTLKLVCTVRKQKSLNQPIIKSPNRKPTGK